MNQETFGILRVRSKPSHAIVMVNGNENFTPMIFNLKPRDLPYEVIIKKNGYIDYIEKITIKSDSKIEINAILAKEKRKNISRRMI